MCKELPSVSTINQLTLNELGGPIYQLGIVAIVSLILTRVGRTLNNRANKLKEQLDVDNDGDVSTNEILQAVASSWKARMRRPSKDVEQEVRSSITNQVDRITQSLQIHDREGMKSLLVDVVEAMVSKNEVARSLDERRSTTRDVSKASVTQLFGV
jgi:gamma-glutamyl:cysteine ligase YbdK (ATP-grasp superfamily)